MPKMSFDDTMDRLMLLIQAGHPIIYITSPEERRVLEATQRIAHRGVNRLLCGNGNLGEPSACFRC